MPQITIPLGTKIIENNQKTIEIQIPNTKFWIIGIQKKDKLWNAYLSEPEINHKEILRKNVTTKSFSQFSNIILKKPFPKTNKQETTKKQIKNFINKITKTTTK